MMESEVSLAFSALLSSECHSQSIPSENVCPLTPKLVQCRMNTLQIHHGMGVQMTLRIKLPARSFRMFSAIRRRNPYH